MKISEYPHEMYLSVCDSCNHPMVTLQARHTWQCNCGRTVSKAPVVRYAQQEGAGAGMEFYENNSGERASGMGFTFADAIRL